MSPIHILLSLTMYIFKRVVFVVLFLICIASISSTRDVSLYSILDDGHIVCESIDGGINCLECDADISELFSVLSVDNIRIIELDDCVIYEGYSNMLDKYRIVDGVKVNIQVSVRDNKTIIGYPLIYGSFWFVRYISKFFVNHWILKWRFVWKI